MNPAVFRTDKQVVFFPVRHHSPAAARLVRNLIEELQPSAVLIEGPSDYNDQIEELFLPHQLPIAIYSYFQQSDGFKRSAFYPFAIYSPEWQALLKARELGAQVSFIDLPWTHMARLTETENQYSDRSFRDNLFIEELCRKLAVDDFDSLWDRIFEIDPEVSVSQYLERCHSLCYQMRHLRDCPEYLDLKREEFMAEVIKITASSCERPVIVVTGGLHSYALWLRLFGSAQEQEMAFVQGATESEEIAASAVTERGAPNLETQNGESNEAITIRGIALTPYSYERLDALTGYEAGMPNPGFYHRVFGVMLDNRHGEVHSELLSQAVYALRSEHKQMISSADLIAVESTARALAQHRGHKVIWRTDLTDAILSSLVKDELTHGLVHPMLRAVEEVFRGSERGVLSTYASLPPLVHDIRRVLREHELEPDAKIREIELDLRNSKELETSRILNQLTGIRIAGFKLEERSDLSGDDEGAIYEIWSAIWSPDFDASCIESAILGGTLAEAATNKLLERSRRSGISSAVAAELLVEACLMGFSEMSDSFMQQLSILIGRETEFANIAEAEQILLFLNEFDEVMIGKTK